uniref:tRNA/rRNA methyltransferase SpoU type domain-containing protein n=1 Tax=Arcella intermedia TaxID=1963864 RepID=A0A6B2KYZ1_9EUKA
MLSLFLACLPNLKDVKDIIQIVDSDNIIKIIHFEKNEEKSYDIDNDHEQINENLSIRWNFITTLISGSPQISKVKLTESSKLKLFENCVHSLEIISYKSLSSLYICLSLLLHTENFLPSHYKQDELLQTIWWSFKNCKRKKPETFRHFLYLYLHPSLFQSTQPEQVLLAKKAFRNVFSLVKHSPRMSSLLAMHLCILLSSPPIALQYPSEILQLCLVSNPDESSSQELSKEKLSPPIIIICSFLATFPSNTAIIEAVVSALIEKSITDKYKIREPTTSGSTNKKKLSIWRTCCVLSPYLNENFADQYQETIWDILELQNFGNVRYYIQIFVISLMIRVPKLIQQRLVKKLEDFDMNYQLATSLVVIAAYLILHFGKMEKFGSMVVELFYKLMPWTNHYMHAVRVAAQTLVMRVIDIPVLQDVINGNEYLKNSLRFIQSNSLISRAVNSQSLILDNFNPVQLCTVEGMFFNNPDFGHETLLLDTINKALKKVRKSFLDKINSPSELPELNPETFQKRIIPWEATISHLDRALFVSEKTSTAGKPRQPLIVVASLLDNTPNIAGLVRTGEIFNVSEILIGNSKILKDPQFKRMTVSSEKHVPISEVKLNNLPEFLGLIRKSGWSVIAVEQTVDSVLLPDFVFPEKCVLVLGQEQEGIPHSLLKQVDRCVEIPQLGTVRSLNVHVSASIVIWEYTRQRLNLQQQTPKIPNI